MMEAQNTMRREQLVCRAKVLALQISGYAPTNTGCDFFLRFGAGPFWFISR